MPAKITRSGKNKRNSSPPSSLSAGIENIQVNQDNAYDEDYTQMAPDVLIASISERCPDPVVHKMLSALSGMIPRNMSELVEMEKRSRSLVISGIEEPPETMRASERRKYLENKVTDILDAVDVDCFPSEVFWMGKPNSSRTRLVKVVLPSSFYWRRALANARFLRNSNFQGVFIRRSMSAEERKREFELRQLARDRNKGKKDREWVVYRGQLVQISELASRRSGNA
ncbi:hypothetical protein Y032_1099g3603 [Ancylostoma ceylanicum]|uniref:Uncharacterized protein n=1 Tax=Ancylostoma ceylanicum TaxID=53326 RepID=A0A016W5Z0_9BILA|nr:hypothetical protein Y032_1099g3603 [Ancylostoma ceylanicum]